MSYDLSFWKYKEGVYLENQEVYVSCSDEITVDGLEDLPINDILKAVALEFKDWQMEDSMQSYENKDGDGSFQIEYTGQFIRFDCYNMEGEDMNRLIDVMIEFQCPLYDSQVLQRYDGN